MKRLAFLFLGLALVGGTVFAAGSSKTFGIGAVYGGGIGDDAPDGSIGLSLRLPSIPIYWSVRLSVADSDMDFRKEALPIKGGLNIDWFIGLGAYGNFGFYDDANISMGGRLPIGLAWGFGKIFELWGALAPSLGIVVAPDFTFPQFYVGYEIGLRAWLQ